MVTSNFHAATPKPDGDHTQSPTEISAKKSIKQIACLFTDIIGSTQFFKSHGNLAGREMLQQHEDIVSQAIIAFGGTVVKSLGDSVMAYFVNPQEAVKIAIRIQKELCNHNKDEDLKNEIHVRIGIHCGEGIIEDNDIFGDVVNVAAKLTNLAGGDQIFISHETFILVNTLSSVRFESIDILEKHHLLAGPTIYQVIWNESADFEPTIKTVICMNPVREMAVDNFDTTWDRLIETKDEFWGREIDDEVIRGDQSIMLIAKKPAAALDVAGNVLKFLRQNLHNHGDTPILPLQIMIDTGPYLEIDKLARDGLPINWAGLRPGALYISSSVYKLIDKGEPLPVIPIPSPDGDHAPPLFEIVLEDYKQQEDVQLFFYQNALLKGNNSPCFYCGGKNHNPTHCPSKHLPNATNTLERLGYLSFDKINDLFFTYLKNHEQVQQTAVKFPEDSPGSELLAHFGFYELKQVFQLRFFQMIWNTQTNEWDKISKKSNGAGGKGGFIWLAQDCIRVSNLSQAESLLQTCLEKYPHDYRVHCALGFLNIEKNNRLWSEYYLRQALHCTTTKPQKIFIRLLLSRLYDLSGHFDKARETIKEIHVIYPYCSEAHYRDIVLKFQTGKASEALRRLMKLIQTNRDYYIMALLDPDLAPYNRMIHRELEKLFLKTRQETQKMARTAEKEFSKFEMFMGKSDEKVEKAGTILSKLRELSQTDSYFGYLDMAYHCNFIAVNCRRLINRRKNEVMDTIRRIRNRLDTALRFARTLHSRYLSDAIGEQLKSIESDFHHISEAANSDDFTTFGEMHARCEETSTQLDKIEPKIQRLKMLQEINLFSIMFFKNTIFILSAVLVVLTVVSPNVIRYLNIILPEFNIPTVDNAGVYHKYFVTFGILGGLFLSFFKSFRAFLRDKITIE